MTKPTDNTKLISLGYVDINSETEVKMRFKEKPDPTNSTNLKKFCFQVKEHDTNLILAAETEEDRESWMSILREAVSGKMHILKNCKVIIDPYNDEDYYSSLTTSNSPNSSPMHNNKIDTFLSMSTSTKSNRKKGGSLLGATISNTAIDYPRKIGYLKKMSTRTKAFGMKSIKKRWFRLEGGKLMYYDDERMNISNLKGTIDLKGAEIVPEPDNLFIFGLKIKNGKFMKFEAVTMKIALEWKDLLSETITLLDSKSNSNNIFNSVLDENYITSERRFNVHSNLDNMQSTNSNSAATYNNRSSAVKKSTDKSADSKKSQSTFGFFFSTNDEGEDENSDEDVPVHVKHKKVNKKHKMSVQTENLLKECLEHHFLFKMIHNQDFLIDRFKEKVTTVGEIIIWEGAVAEDLFYVLESGSCDIIKGNKLISKIHGGTSFGEMALILNNSSRTATFRSSQVCRLWTLRRCDLRELLRQQEEELFQKKINFLSQVTLFEKLTAASIEKIADVMVLRHYEQGEKIIRQGN